MRSIPQIRLSRLRGVCQDLDSSSAQVSSPSQSAGFCISTPRDERGGAMGVITQLLETTAVLIPDFQVLSLRSSVFFSLYCCASSLGFFWAKGVDWGFVFSLLLGYAIPVALNVVSFLSSPSAPT